MSDERLTLKLKAQLYRGDDIAMGPGKADLLDAIMVHGSIAGAGRTLGMSYRRAWQLVGVMNRCWREPLVKTSTGGARGGGATLTPLGQDVLRAYRAFAASLEAVQERPEWGTLKAHIAPKSDTREI